MGNTKAWVQAARLRTLPLSLSGIIVGTALAMLEGQFELPIFILALLTTVGFQVTSNFANDYGDGVKGTDNEDRIGPARAIQSGTITKRALKKGIVASIIISLLIALALIYLAFGLENVPYILLFLLLGLLSIWAAITYTVGANAYGYRGMGDLFVFLFFGLLGVLGSMFLYTKSLGWSSLLPAISIGLLCVAVLNLNNLRDIVSDKKHGKITMVVKMGFKNGKRYHFLLIFMALISFALYLWMEDFDWKQSFFMVAFVPLLIHLRKVMMTKDPGELDIELKKVALSTFLLALLFLISVNIFL
ncbi:1,4-dihydroxy-2-naphthoate octaprenyltransferase [Flagellimonas halotolerans]|uniref:1,4-dihydroxy-2-naphthoate octaprenyltransferase n=1 Tax=Flagellimonas halotolerans TaxID=3112164 RepID=A0ABU6INI7_9FLAO|nr:MULTISPECIES: 1,4-dihydroxy-2-naphthoate octaprenyltransferase [unclassified Allomuricauda]MEC3964732.1 1,4-dihydroxy-2-naphthoate octaprenyltransferase [Muricauda sp. SYSU M86414]MEC4264601.1 1,4-dihydroxy-2-naphthoate octaprenyltransferase [Muricauda sp. SYSU M84420]